MNKFQIYFKCALQYLSSQLIADFLNQKYIEIIRKLDGLKYKRQILEIDYIFWIMFIDFYNLCRILYYSGYNNDSKDMTKNIIINYGGENLLEGSEWYHLPQQYEANKKQRIHDGNSTGGHASSIALFFRKYLYKKTGESTKYIAKHYYFKNNDVEITKNIRESVGEFKDCVLLRFD